MPKLVGIFNTPPVYALGLAGALGEFEVENVTDPIPWARDHRDAAVLVGIHDLGDLAVVVELKAEQPDSVVVTLIDRLDVESVQAALRAGATGSVDSSATPNEIHLALDAAMSNRTLLPALLARRMAVEQKVGSRPASLSEDEVSWLWALASGVTVSELGGRFGFSEREMYRRLRSLYSRMGASGRTDALIKATKWGILD